jgi:hypothetical protein
LLRDSPAPAGSGTRFVGVRGELVDGRGARGFGVLDDGCGVTCFIVVFADAASDGTGAVTRERAHERRRGHKAIRRVLCHCMPHGIGRVRRQIIAQRDDIRRILGKMHPQQLLHGRVREGPGAREQLEREDAKRVLIRASIHLFAAPLFWAHVRGRPDHAGRGRRRGRVAAERAGDAEVRDHRVPAVADENVRRLDVAMHDPIRVRVVERGGDVAQDSQRTVHLQPAALRDELLHAAASHHAHRVERDAGPLADGEDRNDMRMIEPRRELGLTLEARVGVGVEDRIERENLQRDVAVERRLVRAVHDAHAAAAEQVAEHERIADRFLKFRADFVAAARIRAGAGDDRAARAAGRGDGVQHHAALRANGRHADGRGNGVVPLWWCFGHAQ